MTLVADENASCWGLAYEVAEEHVSDTIRYLNVREKAGYLVSFHPPARTHRVIFWISML